MHPNNVCIVSRRNVVQGGAGLIAGQVLLAVGAPVPARGQEQGQGREGQGATPARAVQPRKPEVVMKNPVTEYPRPPFPRQVQEPPGLASRMDPRPDHGEASYRGSGKLAGRKALITGGDSGIGRAAAIAFAREGADVAINYLPVEEPDAREVVELIRSAGRKAVSIPGDIREEAFCRKLVADAVAGLGGLDILVNNAAKQTAVASIADLTTEQFDATFKTNVYAMFWITKAAVPHMPPGSAIINTSSIQAYTPSSHLVDYAQTKSCIVSFTKSMADQLVEKGIRVNAVAPGPFWTPLQPSGGQPPEAIPQFGASAPMGRPGQPVELAPTYVLLASAQASYVTGEVFGGTGGKSPY
jgi:NAD(P)-dependent dehydrogenase (short-subunit alcohol dehydrogenase family)